MRFAWLHHSAPWAHYRRLTLICSTAGFVAWRVRLSRLLVGFRMQYCSFRFLTVATILCQRRSAPEYNSDLLTSVANIPGRSTLRASSCGNLVVPRTRRRTGDKAFSVAEPREWNRLPTEPTLLRSTDSFRRDLKTFLFHSVCGHQDTDWLCDAPSVF